MKQFTINLDEFEYEIIKNHVPFDDSILEGAVMNGIIKQIAKQKGDTNE